MHYFVGKITPRAFLIWESFSSGTLSVNPIGRFMIGFAGHLAIKSS
ncbi:Protein crcB homolog [Helicobacter heilmannii]|nr:Protein crcB homolog [Helicobacter heilmannii]